MPKFSVYFITITSIFITCLIAANLIAVKLIGIGGLVLPAGIIVFPISYIFGDILTEVYGYQRTRLVIWLGFACNLLVVLAVVIAQGLPSASFWDGQAAYERILGYTPRLLLASLVAYLCGEFVNSLVLAKMKIATHGRWLWTRTIGSTLIGQGIDSSIFILIAFSGVIPTDGLVSAILTQWIVKTLYEICATPATYAIVNYLKRVEGIDVYDYQTNFSPLAVQEIK